MKRVSPAAVLSYLSMSLERVSRMALKSAWMAYMLATVLRCSLANSRECAVRWPSSRRNFGVTLSSSAVSVSTWRGVLSLSRSETNVDSAALCCSRRCRCQTKRAASSTRETTLVLPGAASLVSLSSSPLVLSRMTVIWFWTVLIQAMRFGDGSSFELLSLAMNVLSSASGMSMP